jgi:anion-transporting  ArsA/GET3 family ATPase
MHAILGQRSLLYVTGKGGVGKTTVAAALGLAAARAGKRTIVCEVAEQDRMSRAFARRGVGAEQEVELAERLWAITIDPRRALEEWFTKQVGAGPAGRLLNQSSTFQYFVAAAPGAKELITIAKVWELAQPERWNRDDRRYDLVIVDAPASGHGIGMLTTPKTFADIARVGPVRRQAEKVSAMLADPTRTGYLAVALPEEMPVNETIELDRRLHDALALRLDAVVMNAMWPDRFTAADVTKLRAAAHWDGGATGRGGVDAPGHARPAGPGVGAVRAALAAHERAKAQRAHVRRLQSELTAPLVQLPFIFESDLELEHYERLADELAHYLVPG